MDICGYILECITVKYCQSAPTRVTAPLNFQGSDVWTVSMRAL